VSFALGLQAEVVVLPRGVYLTAPPNGSSFVVPTNLVLRANASAGGALNITSVEFFANGSGVQIDTIAPYSVSLTETSPGTRQIFAVATDSVGGTITSAPVNITLSAPAIGTALISFGNVWKYLDDGRNRDRIDRAHLR
jgi:chitinase